MYGLLFFTICALIRNKCFVQNNTTLNLIMANANQACRIAWRLYKKLSSLTTSFKFKTWDNFKGCAMVNTLNTIEWIGRYCLHMKRKNASTKYNKYMKIDGFVNKTIVQQDNHYVTSQQLHAINEDLELSSFYF